MDMKEIHWIPFKTLFCREVARFFKVASQTILTPFISSSLYLTIFGVSLGDRIVMGNDVPYLSFLIPGLVMMGCLNNAFQNTSSSIVSSKFSGELEDLKVAPLSYMQIISALMMAGLLRGMVVAAITLLVGELSFFSVYARWLPIAQPMELLAFLGLGGLAFANLGITVGFWTRSFDQLSAVTGFVLLPLLYLGGVFFSVEHLPKFWKSISLFNPLLYMINGVRHGLLGFSDVDPSRALLISFVAFMVSMGLAFDSLRRGSFQRW
jgi:ABC-2 type transport system permease protein